LQRQYQDIGYSFLGIGISKLADAAQHLKKSRIKCITQ
jgi:hypothetical protein